MYVVPSRQAVSNLEHHLRGSVALHALVGQRRARDVAAKLLQPLALVGSAAHSRVRTETLPVGTQRLSESGVARHGALQREHLLSGARAEVDAVVARGRLQRPD